MVTGMGFTACPGTRCVGTNVPEYCPDRSSETRDESRRTARFSATTKAMPKTRSRLEYQTVSRKRMVRVTAGMCTLEDVSLPTDRLDELLVEPFVQFAAEVVHVHLHRLRERVGVLVPDVLQKLLLGDGTALVAGQIVHKRELFGREMNVVSV